MRSGTNCTITSGEVYSWSRECLLQAKLVKDHGRLCTAAVVLGVVLRAAARSISVSAACCDLGRGPSERAILTALDDGLPKTLVVLERRLNEALVGYLPRRMRRRAWEVAIDLHLDPYYGQPYRSRNEIYYGKAKQGTTKFHAYASACIVEYGRRYTLALTWVRRHESMVTVLRRLLARIREIGLKIRCLLLDRGFFSVAVMALLQQEKLPFLMPVKISGRRPKKGRKATGLRDPAAAGGLVLAYDAKRQPRGNVPGLCRLSSLSERWQIADSETALRRLAGAWLSHRDPRAVSQTIRHRGQLSPTTAGTHLHLHAQSLPAAVLHRRGVHLAQCVGLDSSNTTCRRVGRHHDTSPRTAPLQTHALLDRSRGGNLIP